MEEEHKVDRLVEVDVPQVEHVLIVMDREVGRGFLRLLDEGVAHHPKMKCQWHHQDYLITWE